MNLQLVFIVQANNNIMFLSQSFSFYNWRETVCGGTDGYTVLVHF